MPSIKEDSPVFELATWVGRRQAFGLIASKCSAADAECLKQIRESKRYKSTGSNWEEFCPRYLGVSRAQADRIIQQLEEFGTAYFELSQIVRIPEQAYRAISEAVADHAIEFEGERILISRENGSRIAEVVTLLRDAAQQRDAKTAGQTNLRGIRKSLDSCFERLAAMGDSADAVALIEYGLERLDQLSREVGRNGVKDMTIKR